jgi:uridylate kinase
MDASAFSLCMENKIPIVVLNILKKQNLAKFLIKGEDVGTIVTNAEEE